MVICNTQGLGTNERKLVSLLCCRTNDELQEMKEYYKNSKQCTMKIEHVRWLTDFLANFVLNSEYGNEMEEDVADDLDGEFRLLMISVINAGRDQSDEIDMEKVKEDAQVKYLKTLVTGLQRQSLIRDDLGGPFYSI